MKAKENEAPKNAKGNVVPQVMQKVDGAPSGEKKPSHEVKDEKGGGKTDDHAENKNHVNSKPVEPSHDESSTFDCIFIYFILFYLQLIFWFF